MSDKVNAGVMAWDYQQQPDLDQLDRLVANLSNLRVRIFPVDTGSQEYAIVVANGDLDEAGVRAAYEQWQANDERLGGWVTVEGERP